MKVQEIQIVTPDMGTHQVIVLTHSTSRSIYSNKDYDFTVYKDN